MSSGEEDFSDGQVAHKKRRVSRACDICRRKKVRCDGVRGPGKKCSNCTAFKLNCSYVEAAKKRPPPKAYVAGLEERLKNMENLLHRMTNPEDAFSGPSTSYGGFSAGFNSSADAESPLSGSDQQASPPVLAHARFSPIGDDEVSDDEDDVVLLKQLTSKLESMTMTMSDRFFGKSSGVLLVKTALELKKEWTNDDSSVLGQQAFPERRPEFWALQAWETDRWVFPEKEFPDPDLLQSLVELFFEPENQFMPLLHRPTFERDLASGLHKRNQSFAAVVLGVCACASRFSEDRRILLDGSESWYSAGWKYYSQMCTDRHSVLSHPTIYDLQSYCLRAMFLRASSCPHAGWVVVSMGLRLAQDMGAHRKRLYSPRPTVPEELMKRAFWCMVHLDRLGSYMLGRSVAIYDEDFDVDLPVDCDDEYWATPDPSGAFKQPPGCPSRISAFIEHLKLIKIMGFAMRTIYSINKSKFFLGFVGPDWEHRVTAELDSMLNNWLDSLPNHLRWDPTREDSVQLLRSATLNAFFHSTQIMVHRPFMTRTDGSAGLAFPSMVICTNAARSCTRIADTVYKRLPRRTIPGLMMASGLMSPIVLMLNIWQAKRFGVSVDIEKEMNLVKVWLDMAKSCEDRWYIAGRLWDILNGLSKFNTMPPPQPPMQRSSTKRSRADEGEKTPAHAGANTLPVPSPGHSASSRSTPGTPFDSDDLSFGTFGPPPCETSALPPAVAVNDPPVNFDMAESISSLFPKSPSSLDQQTYLPAQGMQHYAANANTAPSFPPPLGSLGQQSVPPQTYQFQGDSPGFGDWPNVFDVMHDDLGQSRVMPMDGRDALSMLWNTSANNNNTADWNAYFSSVFNASDSSSGQW